MTDRERIAELIGSEHYYKDDWEKIKTGNQPNVSPKDAQWVYDVADRIIKILPELGYTHQPEPEPLFDGNYHCAYCGRRFRIAKQAEFIKHQENCVMNPSQGRVEVVAKYISKFKDWDNAREFIKEGWRYKARSILSLFPEPANEGNIKSQTRQDTLKEVGEWIEKNSSLITRSFVTGVNISILIEALKCGEMPEQSGT